MSKAKSTNQSHFINLGVAALSSALTVLPSTSAGFQLGEDGYIQALPDGHFNAVDGRPEDVPGGRWLMDEVAFAALKANTPHQAGDLVIDYEHQTLNKEQNGQPAPASGWFNIDDVQYRQGVGLFIKPRFTDNAIAHLNAKEYRYFSLVFGYDKATGRPQFIHSAALTNRPGVDGMLPLAQLSALALTQLSANESNPTQPEGLHVNPLLKKLLAALGIEMAEGAQLTEEQQAEAMKRLDDLVKAAGSVDGLKEDMAALSAKVTTQTNVPAGQVDLTQYVPVATVNAMREQLVALSAQNGQLTIEQAVKQALDEGSVLACEKDYLELLGKQQGFAALSAHLAGRKPISALTTTQTTTVDKPVDKSKVAALTADQIKMADSWGMSHADFAKAIAADQEHK
ncbi:phage protease [Shewanella oncorhynchi]|uniref:phage protease n=1 Tax=Shewanella oncorhynchi TaxID=2726434 RepID=UPI002E7B85FF|nr:phage protease [Shewanella oncorhynchi]WVI91402.1 phage protease [Shewanella oncorhynchi]